MERKIVECNIKTIDDKNHVRIWTIKDVDVDSIKFLADMAKKVKTPSPVVTSTSPLPKETITNTKSFIKKKIKNAINKNKNS